MDREKLLAAARRFGADVVGVANIERFRNAPSDQKSV